ncbi:MAG: endonuclease [SAR202 cluster bacterium]|nr:endonuclease [SAR202 cluster bacterium]
MKTSLVDVYERLYSAYGPQHWWPGESAFEVVIGAILTQSAAWVNVEKALANLKSAGVMSAEGLRDVPEARLAELLRPSGYFNMKARKVKAFIDHLWSRYDGDLEGLLSQEAESLREELLGIWGIGEETADDIVLYAASKPVFVIDAYTRRVFERLGLGGGVRSYGEWQALFHSSLPRNAALFNEYHALVVKHGKDVCRKAPRCEGCCLREVCKAGKAGKLGTGID